MLKVVNNHFKGVIGGVHTVRCEARGNQKIFIVCIDCHVVPPRNDNHNVKLNQNVCHAELVSASRLHLLLGSLSFGEGWGEEINGYAENRIE